MARKSKYDTVIVQRKNEIEQWLSEGLNNHEIAEKLGMSRSTWCRYKNEFFPQSTYCLSNSEKKHDERPRWSVYKHIFPNGKVYIGITSNSPTVRWQNGRGYGKGQPLMYNAIRKYGWENVKHEILFTGLTELEAKEKEIELISEYKSNQYEYGYNFTNGGDGTILSGEKIAKRRFDRIAKARNGGVSYSFEEILNNLDVIEKLASKGYSKEAIASHFGISRQTFYEYEKLDADISDTIQRGRSKAIGELENKMFELATGYSFEVTRHMKVRDPGGGEHVEEFTETVVVEPNFNALRFLLTNWSEEYANDPAMIRMRKEEFEHKKNIEW